MYFLLIPGVIIIFFLIMYFRGKYYITRNREPHLPGEPEALFSAKEDAVARFVKAVQIPTVTVTRSTGDLRYMREFQAFLVREYPKIHAVCQRRLFGDHGIMYIWQGQDDGLNPVGLLAHFDVVPAGKIHPDINNPVEGWDFPPFLGAKDEGYIWGRGTLDTKNTLIAIMESVEAAIKDGFIPERSVYLCFGGDEEIGGEKGAGAISRYLQNEGIRFQWILDEGAIVSDGGFPMAEKPLILLGIAQKGIVDIQLTANSTGGHASRPPKTTAPGLLAEAIRTVESGVMPSRLTPTVKKMFQAIAGNTRGVTAYILANIDLLWPVVKLILKKSPVINSFITTTVAPTMLHGADALNVLPVKASCSLNIRILPGDSIVSVMQTLRSVLPEGVDLDEHPDSTSFDPPAVTSQTHPGYEAVERAAKDTFPEAAVIPYLANVTTDSNHFMELTDGIIRFAPMKLTSRELSRIHGTNERISEENFARGIHFYTNLIAKL